MTTQSELEQIVAELVAGIEARETEREPGTFSTAELAEILGVSKHYALQTCHQLKAENKIEPVKFAKVNDWGNRIQIMGWRTVEPIKKKGRK